jgi:hypothetical protein
MGRRLEMFFYCYNGILKPIFGFELSIRDSVREGIRPTTQTSKHLCSKYSPPPTARYLQTPDHVFQLLNSCVHNEAIPLARCSPAVTLATRCCSGGGPGRLFLALLQAPTLPAIATQSSSQPIDLLPLMQQHRLTRSQTQCSSTSTAWQFIMLNI